MTDTAPVNTLPEGVADATRDRGINSIAKLAEAATALTFHRMPGDPAHVGYLRNPGGTVEFIETTPHPRTLALSRVSEVVALAQEHFDADVRAGGSGSRTHRGAVPGAGAGDRQKLCRLVAGPGGTP